MGESLYEAVVESTGLPRELVANELRGMLAASGITRETMELEDLRRVIARYLQDVFLEAKEKYADGVAIE